MGNCLCCFILILLNIRWKSFGSVWMTSTSTWTLLEGNLQGGFFHWYPPKNSKCQPVSKFWHFFDGIYYVIWHLELWGGYQWKKPPCRIIYNPLNCLYLPLLGMWQGERTYQQDWLDLGRFLINTVRQSMTLFRNVFHHIVVIVMLPHETKLTAHFSGRVLSLCVLQDEYWHGGSTEQCSW